MYKLNLLLLKFSLLSLLLPTFLPLSCEAQTLVTSSGGIENHEGIDLSWSIGEVLTVTINTQQGLISQGFHQPFPVIPRQWKSDITPAEVDVRIAPNPAKTSVELRFFREFTGDVSVIWFDLTGRHVDSGGPFPGTGTLTWDVSWFAAGEYVLCIQSEDGSMYNFLVTKVE